MDKHITLLMTSIGLCGALHAQQRYVDEVFTDDQITISSGLEYAVNINFLTSDLGCPPEQIGAELTELQTLATLGQPYPDAYYVPDDPGSCLKLARLRMDVYQPDQAVDDMACRPLVIYVHNGTLLPPCTNCSPIGQRSDSAAVEVCRRLARRGYVAASIDYRLGWNPLAASSVEARIQLINAVYRAMHDTKMAIRHMRADAGGQNAHGIDPGKVILMGQGTGAFITLAAVSLDREEELFAGQLLCDEFQQVSCVNTELFGAVTGFGGNFNLYRPNGYEADVQFSVNLGGAVVDTLWIEPGDAPMVSFHCVRDDLVPFDRGIVETATGLPIFEVFGSNAIIRRANALGNNAGFAQATFSDPISLAAEARYGTNWEVTIPPDQVTVISGDAAKGLFPIVRPLAPSGQNEGQPWQWWDAEGPFGICATPCGVSGHQAGLATNPDMSEAKAMSFIDSVMSFMTPRIHHALALAGQGDLACAVGLPDAMAFEAGIHLHPNPASDQLLVTSTAGSMRSYELFSVTGALVRTATVNADRFVLVREGLGPGVYLIRLHHAKGAAVRRMVFE